MCYYDAIPGQAILLWSASMTLAAPHTWLMVGTEMFSDEHPENDAARREQLAAELVRSAVHNIAVTYDVPQSLSVLDRRIDSGELQWVYVGEGKQRFRFAALSVPELTNDRGQELAAIVVASTRKYKTGREGMVKALCRALAETLGPADEGRIWLQLQRTVARTEWSRSWMVFWWVGRGAAPAATGPQAAALEDILANPGDPASGRCRARRHRDGRHRSYERAEGDERLLAAPGWLDDRAHSCPGPARSQRRGAAGQGA